MRRRKVCEWMEGFREGQVRVVNVHSGWWSLTVKCVLRLRNKSLSMSRTTEELACMKLHLK